jgi:hypothetical protein
MATFSGAINLLTGTFNVQAASNNTTITGGETVYTAPAGKKTILYFTNFHNSQNGALSMSFNYRRKDPQSGSYTTMFSFTADGTSVSGPFTLSMSTTDVQKFINYGIAEFNGDAPTSAGNVRIVMMPEDRITVAGGTCPNNSTIRVCGRTEEYYSNT